VILDVTVSIVNTASREMLRERLRSVYDNTKRIGLELDREHRPEIQ
jgi:hypothetical protein